MRKHLASDHLLYGSEDLSSSYGHSMGSTNPLAASAHSNRASQNFMSQTKLADGKQQKLSANERQQAQRTSSEVR